MRRNLAISSVFPKYHPRAGESTRFEEAIFRHKKIHTIRSGHRWKAGDTARVFTWTGIPYKSKQRVLIPALPIIKVYDFDINWPPEGVYINDVFYGEFDEIEMRHIAENDGLNVKDFIDWFSPHIPFDGQIICWNENVKYG